MRSKVLSCLHRLFLSALLAAGLLSIGLILGPPAWASLSRSPSVPLTQLLLDDTAGEVEQIALAEQLGDELFRLSDDSLLDLRANTLTLTDGTTLKIQTSVPKPEAFLPVSNFGGY